MSCLNASILFVPFFYLDITYTKMKYSFMGRQIVEIVQDRVEKEEVFA